MSQRTQEQQKWHLNGILPNVALWTALADIVLIMVGTYPQTQPTCHYDTLADVTSRFLHR